MIDSIEDIFQQNLIIDNEYNKEHLCSYDKLPTKFVSIESWIIKTNLHCNYCTLTFDGRPVIIPETIKIDKKGRKIYPVYNNICFCDFPCAVAYILKSSVSNKKEKIDMLNDIYFQFYGKRPIIIKEPEYSRECLEMYGGDKTIKEYKDVIKKAIGNIVFSIL